MASKKNQSQQLPSEFYILCGDISLLRPGFAILKYSNGKAEVIDMCNLDNHNNSKKKGHGKILREIAAFLKEFIVRNKILDSGLPIVCIREDENCGRSASNFATSMTISKAIGITDVVLDTYGLRWTAINNQIVKMLVCGKKKDENIKQLVAEALKDYVGEQDYKTDDESDAVSMGVAYLIQNGIFKAHEPC